MKHTQAIRHTKHGANGFNESKFPAALIVLSLLIILSLILFFFFH